MHFVDQVAILFAGTKGYLDSTPRSQVQACETQFLRYFKEQTPEIRNGILKEKKLTPDLAKGLEKAIKDFGHQFRG